MRKAGGVVRQGKERRMEVLLPSHLADPPSHSSTHNQAGSSSSLRRQAAASMVHNRRLVHRNGKALEPHSPASFTSSIELTGYNQAVTPTSSLDFKGKYVELGYALKTSTELLKVLNKIWKLEEQHESNISLIKTLKLERDHARARLRHLMQDQQTDRHEIEGLMKHYAEDTLMRRCKEKERIKTAVQPVREELEYERNSRARSESLHLKLTRELADVKSAFSKAIKELKREKSGRFLLEDFCDEVAKGVVFYDRELGALKQLRANGQCGRGDKPLVHIAEAWLDERLQMKLAESHQEFEKNSTIVDRLKSEIETFLHAKKCSSLKFDPHHDDLRTDLLCRCSLESVHLNNAASAPRLAGGDGDSSASDFHCLEISKDKMSSGDVKTCTLSGHGRRAVENDQVMTISSPTKQGLASRERTKNNNISSFAVGGHLYEIGTLQDRVSGRIPDSNAGGEARNRSQIEISMSEKSRRSSVTPDQNLVAESFMRSHSVPSAGGTKSRSGNHHKLECHSRKSYSHANGGGETSGSALRIASPVRRWNYHQGSPDMETFSGSIKVPPGIKENTLKAKLLEARLEGKQARLISSKGTA